MNVSSSDSIYDIELGDLDGDGDLDVGVSTSSGTDGLKVYKNDGTGGSFTAIDVGNVNYPSLQLGDVDADGDWDLFSMDFSSPPNFFVFHNDGIGNFGSATQTTMSVVNNRMILGDVNNDGAVDAISANNETRPIDFFVNDGTGVFTQSSLSPVSSGAQDAQLADIDADGDLDLAFTVDSDTAAEDGLYLYRNDGSGNFSSINVIPLTDPSGLQFADQDNDGDLDIYVVEGGTSLRLLINQP
ncbi:MAG: VCBS repeat-containing protein [Pleurocapsa sp. SU_196_0]|nr:VCBS repeat-containing protein [Pleurocapsa sp. SU_196_0]